MTGNGLSAGDVLALSKDNDGFLGDGIWGIIMLLIIAGLFSGNGFGWGNRDKGITEEYIANQFTQRDLYNNNTNILETKYALGTEILNNKYTNELGVQNIIASQKDCCCTTRYDAVSSRNTNQVLTTDNTEAYTPKNDYNPAPKKYVDDKLTTITGYDATKTQTLKNINGVLTWQTDGE